MLEMFRQIRKKQLSKEDVAEMLKINPVLLEEFEKSYAFHALSETSDNFFELNAKQAAAEHKKSSDIKELREELWKDPLEIESEAISLISRIVNELASQTPVWCWDGKQAAITPPCALKEPYLSIDDLLALPEDIRPFCAGMVVKNDISTPAYPLSLEMYKCWITKKDRTAYHIFRQGLDLLDLDPVLYRIIDRNCCSMGYWLPRIVDAVSAAGFFKIPKTKIIKVPLPLLQLTRLDYGSLNRVTLDIVDQFCQQVFDLNVNENYFIKNGVFSSKFDFRNAKVTGDKEVRELGEYLLFIHHQACMMAAPLNNTCMYGAGTTVEWVVREYISDTENNPCIYKGLPLHTEYRVFVDFDTQEILGINPYWDPEVMKRRFSQGDDADSPHNIHDYIIYSAHEKTLMERYEQHKEQICQEVLKFLPEAAAAGMAGQWSVDIMQNGNDFYLIDMAPAENSALATCIPTEKRRPLTEDWLPRLENKLDFFSR